jgi:hypothetical protein
MKNKKKKISGKQVERISHHTQALTIQIVGEFSSETTQARKKCQCEVLHWRKYVVRKR